MQTISFYPIDAYQQITNPQLTLEETILSSMSYMPLILQATVIVRDGATYDIYSTSETESKYSKWRYFTGEIEQFAENEPRVSLLQDHISYLLQKFSLRFIINSEQGNYKKTLDKMAIRKYSLLTIVFAYSFPSDIDPGTYLSCIYFH